LKSSSLVGVDGTISIISHNSLVSPIGLIGLIGLIGYIGFGGFNLSGLSGLIKLIGLDGLISHNSLIGLPNQVGYTGIIGFISHYDLISHNDLISLGLVSLVGPINRISLIGLGFVNLICLVGFIGLVGLIGLVLGHISQIGHIGLIGFIGIISLVSFGLNGYIGKGIIVNSLQFEVEMKQSQHDLFRRESWLWCVRRVISSLAGLDSVFGNTLQNATQLFFDGIPQMTKYCIMRECGNVLSWISLRGGLVFSHQQGIYGFKFPKRFLEISSRDLTSSFLLQLI
jgi:hypothetical protein